MRNLLVAVLLLVLFALAAPAADWSQNFVVSGVPEVRIRTNDAPIEVVSRDTREVRVEVRAIGLERGRDYEVYPSQSGNRVDVEVRRRGTNFSFWGRNRSLEIRVTVPPKANLNLESGDGHVSVEDVSGEVRAHTGDGHIDARHLEGNVELRSGDGHINVEDMSGALQAHTGDGHVTVRGRFERLAVETGDGAVEVSVETGSQMRSSWSVRTNDGSIRLAVPGGFAADFDISTGDGRIHSELPLTTTGINGRSELHGKLNAGGGLFTVHTGDGSIDLVKN